MDSQSMRVCLRVPDKRTSVLVIVTCLVISVLVVVSRHDVFGQHKQVLALEIGQVDKPAYSLQSDHLPSLPPASHHRQASSVEELGSMLTSRLALPNDADRIVYSSPCDSRSRNLTGCTDASCKHQLSSDPLERLRDLVSFQPLQLSDGQLDTVLSLVKNVPESDVIFVSASSSNHYAEMQAMFHDLHTVVFPVMHNFSVVVFDLGLTRSQRDMTEKKCKCQVVTFPREKFPGHVGDNHCYSWKPIIIRAMIERARKVLVWQDSSIRWGKDFQMFLDRTEKYGQQIIRYKASSRVTANTLKQTFQYMKEEPCTFFPYPEVQASVSLFKHDPLVIQAVLDPWTRCALEKGCICPVMPPVSVLPCKHNTVIHRCHRFDQSALSIILAKVYGLDMDRVIAPEFSFQHPQHVTIKRGHKMDNYFTG